MLERGRVIALGRYRAKLVKGRVMGIPFQHVWTVRAGRTIALDAVADCGCMPPA
ncbi:hypothetical protein KPL78_04985 [Roseomonas sp. HJA6]|uniref:Uncharacterized protein n=1 Tax=Roseomonas alba TaxID=2846776 RepID=A0ABS7A4J5_9PROT|nr:hypothetical protein [Neoroseomonas alba]MBW6397191.1 hypothetical protein [Neoroseomonas alba]